MMFVSLYVYRDWFHRQNFVILHSNYNEPSIWTVMKFDIENEICLGVSHSGAVKTEGIGILELDDNEVSLLIDIIKEKKNCDVDELDI